MTTALNVTASCRKTTPHMCRNRSCTCGMRGGVAGGAGGWGDSIHSRERSRYRARELPVRGAGRALRAPLHKVQERVDGGAELVGLHEIGQGLAFELGGLRVAFELDPAGTDLAELRLQLLQDSTPISEVWLFRWTS